jgi:hypothetical protein
MLEFLRGKLSNRKLRLLACACCRRIWQLLNEESQQALMVAERYADQSAAEADLIEACDVALGAARSSEGEAVWWAASTDAFDAAFAASYAAAGREACLGWPGRNESRNDETQFIAEISESVKLLRDIFGNPFRPVNFDPEWRTTTALALATGIYDERAFDRLPILADALQDAGCDNDDILTHLRDTTTPHVRGCWALDLVLGKE